MNQEDAFIQAVLLNPEDAVPRLIYADWLEERGDPRCEIIRERCWIADVPERDRANVEMILRRAWVEHWDEWIEHCGLLLTWDRALTLFERRLAETVAWCESPDTDSLRTPTLRPECLFGRFVVSHPWQVWSRPTPQVRQVWSRPNPEERQKIVNALANRRGQLLVEKKPPSVKEHPHLSTGRLVLFDPEGTLSDGAAELESEGYFDADNVPAWDTWVCYTETGTGRDAIDNLKLVAWVPPHLVDAVDRGIRVNPEECIRWATDVDTTLTRKLRDAGLLT